MLITYYEKGKVLMGYYFGGLDYSVLVSSFFIWKNATVARIKPIQINSNPMMGMNAPISMSNPAVPNKPIPDFVDN